MAPYLLIRNFNSVYISGGVKMSRSLIKGAFASLLSIAFIAGLSAADENKIVIKGSTTVLPITMKAVEAYKKLRPQINISVEGSGSGNGIKSLLEGTTDIANSSREIKKEEIEKGAASGKKIKEITVAHDMLVPIVHPSNSVKNLTKDQLKAIYDGTIKNWKEVGGSDEKIVVVSRETSSGTYEYWNEAIMKSGDVRKDSLVQASNGAVVNVIANNKKAIGYIGYGYVTKSIKVLQVNSIEATIANGKSKKYPISRELYMYVDENKYNQQTKDFVSYLLGPQGQKIVVDAGYLSLK
jgi:phosphate transport system substrate-binding protein